MPKNGETRPFFSLKNLISVFGNYMDVKTVVAAYFLFFNFLKKKTLDVMKTLTKLKVFIFLRFVVKNKVSKPWLTRCALVASFSSQPEPLYLACEATQVNTFPLREQQNHFSKQFNFVMKKKRFFCRLVPIAFKVIETDLKYEG